jgi:alkanesulfonate monooxygenase SsuD/methylene tetrahydromethanopterin reductase-like flavin-dependent oxidoreductase (luciferase family)
MEIGIGLPNTVSGTTGRQITAFAQAAEEAGFSTLGTIDRIVYPNYEPLVALSAAAAVTERIRLATTVMLGPLRGNPTMVAKQALSLDALAGGGRVVLGIAIGAREDDYEISGVAMSERGTWLDDALPRIRRIWNGEGEIEPGIGPRPEGGGPSLIVGGHADVSIERAARHGDGWIFGGGRPEQFGELAEKLTSAWERHGRGGEPHTMALAYFSLGDAAEEAARRNLGDYYAFLGEEMAGMLVGSAATDADTVRAYLSGFEQAGADELVLFPSSSDPGQVGLLAEAAGL